MMMMMVMMMMAHVAQRTALFFGGGVERGGGADTRSLSSPPVAQASMVARVSLGGGRVATLVGVLHGAPSSLEDVRRELEEVRPCVVVVELCASRWRSLVKEDLVDGEDEGGGGGVGGAVALAGAWGARAARSATRAAQRKGPAVGAAALLLGSLFAIARAVGNEARGEVNRF